MRELLFRFLAAAHEPCPAGPADNWGLTAPQATVIAAFIAVVGAGIAFAGVMRTTGAARRETRRKERIEVLEHGLGAVQDLARAIARIGSTEPQNRAEYIAVLNSGPIDEYLTAIATAASRLMLYGFSDIANTAAPVTLGLRDLWEEARRNPTATVIDPEKIEADVKPVIIAFLDAFATLK